MYVDTKSIRYITDPQVIFVLKPLFISILAATNLSISLTKIRAGKLL